MNVFAVGSHSMQRKSNKFSFKLNPLDLESIYACRMSTPISFIVSKNMYFGISTIIFRNTNFNMQIQTV